MVQTALDKAQEDRLKRMVLLGTKFTMQNDFFKQPFETACIKMFLPSSSEQALIHQKIVDELENGIVKDATKQQL